MGGESGRRREQKHMIVVRIEHSGDGEEGVATGAVLDHNRLAPFRGELVGQQPGRDVDARTWTKRNDETDRALRPLVRGLRLRERRCDNRGSEAKEKGH